MVHALRGEEQDYTRFETDIWSLRDSISPLSSPEELMVGTGSALRSLQDYNRRSAASFNGHAKDLQSVVSLLIEAVIQLSGVNTGNVGRLREVAQQLGKTSPPHEIRPLVERLAECLLGIREDKIRSAPEPGALTTGVEPSRACDQLTGLGSRPNAESALALALDQEQSSYAAFFVIDHLHSLNQRFGRKLGDEIIAMFAVHLAQNLRADDVVYRWSGPSFLVLLNRECGSDKLRRELLPVLRTRLEKTVESNNRMVLLPINFTWMLFPILECKHTSHLVAKIDAFLHTQIGPET